MLKLFHQPQSFIFEVAPNRQYFYSVECYSEVPQKHNAAILAIEFLGVDNSKLLASDIGLLKSDVEGFWSYISSGSGTLVCKKEFRVPEKCYAIKMTVKKWHNDNAVYINRDLSVNEYNSDYQNSSFKKKVLDRIKGLIDPEQKTILGFLDHKYNAYSFAEKYDFKTPKKICEWSSLESIDFTSLPASFVFKPLWAHTNKGVFLIDKKKDGHFYDRMRNMELTITELKRIVVDELSGLSVRSTTTTFFAEELLNDAHGYKIPMDYRVYSFYGRVGLVMQRSLNDSSDPQQWRFRFYDREWNDLGRIKFHGRVDAQLPLPIHCDEMIEYAERLSKYIEVPFIRIDLYDTPDGIVLGELTPTPGGYDQYDFEIDQYLGEIWNDAEERLKKKSRWYCLQSRQV